MYPQTSGRQLLILLSSSTGSSTSPPGYTLFCMWHWLLGCIPFRRRRPLLAQISSSRRSQKPVWQKWAKKKLEEGKKRSNSFNVPASRGYGKSLFFFFVSTTQWWKGMLLSGGWGKFVFVDIWLENYSEQFTVYLNNWSRNQTLDLNSFLLIDRMVSDLIGNIFVLSSVNFFKFEWDLILKKTFGIFKEYFAYSKNENN